ncbi:uncharacterized protein LACBIDRAFT_328726 [Laccaria bicolor S238N-H82]|uniref:Predicted protein n=1 Tax=Laccaria bicolor (strain S238N-H82 / ATCC MYA-4686) TaxID=486041 RepID=B0DFT5_LACBS|nr:uncharacterized protein LACBIDRAFT_328726 [Laccaria bicolor S238N-H82]EDR06399.1 predicted protein [Laccaria bicolor S238N-H82]|eukprot:XP_001882771.1 predicted protein [Laccaria bicolor S238N-H82]
MNKELLGTNAKQKQLTLKSFTKKEPELKKPKLMKPDPKIAESPATSPAVQDLPSYPWFKNSCWLDSSLQLLHTTMHCSVDEFKAIYNALPENSAIRPAFSHLLEWYDLNEAEKTTSTFLHRQWDSLCTHLKKKKVFETVSGFESLFTKSKFQQLVAGTSRRLYLFVWVPEKIFVICLLLSHFFEVGDEHPSKTMPQEWDFPSTLLPHTQSAANSHGLVYDLMGLALTNEDGNHFIAQYASDNKKVIYMLFSMTYHSDQFVKLKSNKCTWLLNPFEITDPRFWYPVHLIQAVQHGWRVHWWRENQFLDKDKPAAGGFSVVNTKDIVDSLWNNRLARRAIWLGKWKHAWDIETSEDILTDPSEIPYSEEINKILSPFKKLLKKLFTCYGPDDVKSEIILARDWLENGKKPLQTSLVLYCGALSIVQRAQIANWFLCHISKNAETWLGRLPLAHAFTLYSAEHIKNEPKFKVLTQPEIINEAWRIQFTSIPSVLFDIDVEHEALENLETEMFEVSRAAGIDGRLYQWGLDTGHHQDWDPYARMEDLNHQDCPGDDDDLQFGPDYIHREEIIQLTEKKSRPKPRPKMIKKTAPYVQHTAVNN